jgi:hypothetical protein
MNRGGWRTGDQAACRFRETWIGFESEDAAPHCDETEQLAAAASPSEQYRGTGSDAHGLEPGTLPSEETSLEAYATWNMWLRFARVGEVRDSVVMRWIDVGKEHCVPQRFVKLKTFRDDSIDEADAMNPTRKCSHDSAR